MGYMKEPKILYKLGDTITPVMETEIKRRVTFNLEEKMSSALKKIAARGEDVEIKIDIKIDKNKQDKYEGNFCISYDGIQYPINDFPPYKILADLINHAFEKMSTKILAK